MPRVLTSMDLVFSTTLMMLAVAFMCGFLCFRKIDPATAMLGSHVVVFSRLPEAVKSKE